jgi:hypothetical protein
MNFLKNISVAAVLTAGTTALAGPVVNLAPSQIADGLSGIDNSAFVEIRGAAISDKYIDFSIYSDSRGDAAELLYEGTLMTRVVRSHMTGNLHFNYRIMDANAELAGRVSHVEIAGFGEFDARVEYRNDSISTGDEGPWSAVRDSSGDIINFAFDGGLDTADESHYFFAMLNTDTFFEDSAVATVVLESGERVALVVDSPTMTVPAPSSLALIAGAGLLGARRRR